MKKEPKKHLRNQNVEMTSQREGGKEHVVGRQHIKQPINKENIMNKDSSPAFDQEAITEAVFAAISGNHTNPVRLVRRQYIEETFGISRSTIYRLMSGDDKFPIPVTLPGNGVRWVWSEVMEWANGLIKARDEV